MSERGNVFDRGVADGTFTDARIVHVTIFHSSEDEGYCVMLDKMHGLSTFGTTPEEALKEFCIMLPAAIESGLTVESISTALAQPRAATKGE